MIYLQINTVKYNVDKEVMNSSISVFSPFCYYSFILGQIQKSFDLLVFRFDLFDKWQRGIRSLSNSW